MGDVLFDGRSDLEEVRRRLRLSRLVPGIGSSTAQVLEQVGAETVDIEVMISPPDPDLAVQIGELFPDIRIVVTQRINVRYGNSH